MINDHSHLSLHNTEFTKRTERNMFQQRSLIMKEIMICAQMLSQSENSKDVFFFFALQVCINVNVEKVTHTLWM